MKQDFNIVVDRHHAMLANMALCKHSISFNLRGSTTSRLKQNVL